ncbi:MAG: putative signal transduction protein [Polyangiaceae bacterium]|nr:putative signal transduction protein [Polyangiaceae bacterium]
MSDENVVLRPLVPGEAESGVHATESAAKRRILFVDDEPSILEGLRSALRPQRREWDTAFALGGAAAIEELERRTFDVIVTDMRMPVVDGAELLRRVKQLQPRAVRIVLSGQTDAETAMKTVFMAHQFLAKPCELEKLRALVKRACNLNELVAGDELRALAGDAALLPAAPRTYSNLTQALAEPASNLATVANIVERDPALCAKVLQVVNSAFFGLPRSVSSIAQAANFLGTLTLRNLALAMESVSLAKRMSLGLSDKQLVEFQINSLLVALLGRHWFAGDRRRADEAFVAGMLRDMGHLLLAKRRPEEKCGSHNHAALSAYLLGLWGIPHAVLEPVAFHENPEAVEHDTLEVVDVVHLADRIAAELAPSPFQTSAPPLDVDRLEQLGASASRLDAFRQDATAFLTHARELLRS